MRIVRSSIILQTHSVLSFSCKYCQHMDRFCPVQNDLLFIEKDTHQHSWQWKGNGGPGQQHTAGCKARQQGRIWYEWL